jgi:hypothetical protein
MGKKVKEMIAYCGLKCHECDVYIATKANDREKIEKLSKEYSSGRQFYAPEDIWCDGCTEKNGKIFSWCKECLIRNCGSERGVPNCIYCEDFPCEIVEGDPGGAKERLAALKQTL